MAVDFLQFLLNFFLANFLMNMVQIALIKRNSPSAPAVALIS